MPLIVRSAATRPGERVDTPVSLVDLAPTVLDLVGGDVDTVRSEQGLSGYSLFGDRHSPVITTWAEANSLRTERWRYTRYPDGSEELYDHGEDPEEHHNLAAMAEHGEQLAALRDALAQLR